MKTAHASSVYHSIMDVTRSIDGNPDTRFHTGSENKPWLQVELNDVRVVHHIAIINRKDCCGYRTKNMQVRVGFTYFSRDTKTLNMTDDEICATYIGPGKNGEKIIIDCKNPMGGKYVSVQLMQEGNAIMNFNEIMIYGITGNIYG